MKFSSHFWINPVIDAPLLSQLQNILITASFVIYDVFTTSLAQSRIMYIHLKVVMFGNIFLALLCCIVPKGDRRSTVVRAPFNADQS